MLSHLNKATIVMCILFMCDKLLPGLSLLSDCILPFKKRYLFKQAGLTKTTGEGKKVVVCNCGHYQVKSTAMH